MTELLDSFVTVTTKVTPGTSHQHMLSSGMVARRMETSRKKDWATLMGVCYGIQNIYDVLTLQADSDESEDEDLDSYRLRRTIKVESGALYNMYQSSSEVLQFGNTIHSRSHNNRRI